MKRVKRVTWALDGTGRINSPPKPKKREEIDKKADKNRLAALAKEKCMLVLQKSGKPKPNKAGIYRNQFGFPKTNVCLAYAEAPFGIAIYARASPGGQTDFPGKYNTRHKLTLIFESLQGFNDEVLETRAGGETQKKPACEAGRPSGKLD